MGSDDAIIGETLARRLVALGVHPVLALPGTEIDGLVEGFRRVRDDLRWSWSYSEEAAGFMATGCAVATGRDGVCVGMSEPGAI